MKKNILCIIGESGSGKTHIADYIEENYGIQYIQSHTERPKRNRFETGHTWHTKESFDKIKRKDMIAYTVYGGNRYCATRQDLDDWNIYVIDEPGLEMLMANHQHEFNIKSLRIVRHSFDNIDATRRDRAINTYQMKLGEFDYVVFNNQTVEKLDEMVDSIMDKYLNRKV